MGDIQNGQSGGSAVYPVAQVSRRESESVTILYLLMEAATVQDQTQKHAAVKENHVQVLY